MTGRPNREIRSATIAWLLVAGYAVLVSVLSHMSRPPVPEVLQSAPGTLALHLLAFAGLGFLFYRALSRSWRGLSEVKLVLVTIAACAVFGALDELHQSFVPGRFCQAIDVAADTIGGTVAALLLAAAGRSKTQARTEKDERRILG